MHIGQLVKFEIPGLQGPRTVAGIVKRLLPHGLIEIKSQNDGYHTLNIAHVRPVPTHDGPYDPPYGQEVY